MNALCQKPVKLLNLILLSFMIVSPLRAEQSQLGESEQCILVVTPDWKSQTGTLCIFERENTTSDWRQRGQGIPVIVGRGGLGWGKDIAEDGPLKHEGDGRSPAGIFRLDSAFGYAPQREASWIKLPYRTLFSTTEAIDDPHSSYYNQMLERTQVPAPDWRTSEQMLRKDDCYKWGVIVDYNVNPVKAGAGSCVFLHIWRDPRHPTAGCTAMEEKNLVALLRWLDPKANPVLVQLTLKSFQEWQPKLNLPTP